MNASTALVFPGQGAQHVGMGQGFLDADPAAFRRRFDRASEVLGIDLASICLEGPEQELTRSDRAQPAIFVVSVLALDALRSAVPAWRPAAAAGLSSGEWAALYAAGVVGFDDALKVLDVRGRTMQEACRAHPGGMLSVIGLDRAALEKVADTCGVQLANINSHGQIVLSGPVEGIERAETAAVEAGARRALRLPVAGAFHSRLMAGAAEAFGAFLEEVPLAEPEFPVYSNVTGERHADPASIRRRMVEQVTESVRWVDNVEALRRDGIDRAVECGPGKVLTGLMKRIDKDLVLHTIQDPSAVDGVADALRG